jgi:hypothetical protein
MKAGAAPGAKPAGKSTASGLMTAGSTTTAGNSLRIVQQFAFTLIEGTDC